MRTTTDEERLPLIPRAEARRSVQEVASTSLVRYAGAVNTLAFSETFSMPFRAFPPIYPNIYRSATYTGLALCAGNLALDVAADRKAEIACGESAIRAEDVKRKVSHAESGANTFYFFLGFYIATYIAIDAAVNKLGDKEVDTSDSAYLLAFVLPSALFGLAHIYLEATKSAWQQRVTTKEKIMQGAHALVSTLYSAGTLNEFMMSVLSKFGVSESGNVDPNLRIGLYGSALAAGVGFQFLSYKRSGAVQPIKRLLQGTTAVNYLSVVFGHGEAEEFDSAGRAVIGATFATLAVASLASSVLYPELKEEPLSVRDFVQLESDASSQAEEVSVRSESGSEAEEVSVRSEPDSDEDWIARISPDLFSGSASPTFFSCRSSVPSRVASAPDVELENSIQREACGRGRSKSF